MAEAVVAVRAADFLAAPPPTVAPARSPIVDSIGTQEVETSKELPSPEESHLEEYHLE
jgi:hypothetical protein